MYWLLALMSISLLGVVALGFFFEVRPAPRNPAVFGWLRGAVGLNLLTYFGALVGVLFLGVNDVMAAEPAVAAEAAKEVSLGLGLALIGIGLPTAVATVAAAIAVGPVGTASLAVIAEKPEVFGRTLVYLGLAEGIAIYGLVVTILLLGKI
ncbi:MAG: ATPase [Gammaproteobacteria bacterium]|nr:ATPase [Gammaproteobacteria bacterium]